MTFSYTISPLGDSALLIEFGHCIDEVLNKKVLALFRKIKLSALPFTDVIPAYSSLAVCYDVEVLCSSTATAFDNAKNLVEPLLKNLLESGNDHKRTISIPVCYSKKFGWDLVELAMKKNISVTELIRLHTAKAYRVYMIGFLPGFAYMGMVDEKIAMPRRSQPRTDVPAGSVGIAGEQTGIYPFTSPGGWNIIGRTPLTVFDAGREDAVLFQPGDEVSFYSITEDEFKNYQSGNF